VAASFVVIMESVTEAGPFEFLTEKSLHVLRRQRTKCIKRREGYSRLNLDFYVTEIVRLLVDESALLQIRVTLPTLTVVPVKIIPECIGSTRADIYLRRVSSL
jgi:hypothetical protein